MFYYLPNVNDFIMEIMIGSPHPQVTVAVVIITFRCCHVIKFSNLVDLWVINIKNLDPLRA